MVIGIKDMFKMFGIIILSCCAVLVCTLFLNYNLDLKAIESSIEPGMMQIFYDAQIMTGKVVSGVSGGCLIITTIVMLVFYIKQYIDAHGKELGILKAMGYSNFKIAKNFSLFGCTVLTGAVLGFIVALTIMPMFYQVQNEDNILPEIPIHIHSKLVVLLIVLPSLLFAVLATLYAYLKLKIPALELIKGKSVHKIRKAKIDRDLSFLTEIKTSTLRQKRSLIFFIGFASFCYSSMLQMSFSMEDLSSEMMAAMMITIGMVLACVTLFIGITTVVNANRGTIAIMKAFGYHDRECSRAILSGYRPVTYVGFLVGTFYQFLLLKIMVEIVFRDVDNVPEFHFNFLAFAIALISFLILYELILYCYTKGIQRISIKEIMMAAE